MPKPKLKPDKGLAVLLERRDRALYSFVDQVIADGHIKPGEREEYATRLLAQLERDAEAIFNPNFKLH